MSTAKAWVTSWAPMPPLAQAPPGASFHPGPQFGLINSAWPVHVAQETPAFQGQGRVCYKEKIIAEKTEIPAVFKINCKCRVCGRSPTTLGGSGQVQGAGTRPEDAKGLG